MPHFSQTAVLIVGSELVEVEVELGSLTPGTQWGGFFRGVPIRLAAALRQDHKALLLLPDGQEKRVRPAGIPQMDRQGRLVVPFLGEGPAPVESD